MSNLLDEIPSHISTMIRKVRPGTETWETFAKIKEEIDQYLRINNIKEETYQMLYDFEDGSLIFKCRNK